MHQAFAPGFIIDGTSTLDQVPIMAQLIDIIL